MSVIKRNKGKFVLGVLTLIGGAGALVIAGTNPSITVGDGGAEDTKIVFDGAAQDFYCGLDDSADDLVCGLGSTVGTTPAFSVDENQLLTISADALMNGTTPTLTIGDAGAEDTKIVFDGAAQDFYCGLDDSADDLVCGLGSAVGTTPAFAIDENQDLTITNNLTTGGSLNFDSGEAEVTTDAVTINATVGKINDTTDITAGADRTAITFTNSRISATSYVMLSNCSTPDAGASLVLSATSTAGAATVQVSNEGAANQTSTYSVCFLVFD